MTFTIESDSLGRWLHINGGAAESSKLDTLHAFLTEHKVRPLSKWTEGATKMTGSIGILIERAS